MAEGHWCVNGAFSQKMHIPCQRTARPEGEAIMVRFEGLMDQAVVKEKW